MGKFTNVIFSEICDFENGDRGKNYPSRSAYIKEGIPFISAGNITDNKIDENSLNFISRDRFDLLGSGKVKRGDILFCLRGSLGKFAVIDKDIDGGIASSLVIIRPKDKVNLGFLKLYLESHLCSKMIEKYDNGTAQPNLSGTNLKKFVIPLPPLPEQKRIVAKLDGLFEKIDKAISLLEENIEHTQALMGSVLDEEFGRLKTNKKKLEKVVKIIGGGTPSKRNKMFYNGTIPWASVRDMNVHKLKSTEYSITEKAVQRSSTNIIPKGNLIISTRVGLGKVCLLGIDCAINQDLKGIIPKENVLVEYLYYWFNSISEKIISNGSGATVKGVKLDFIKNLEFPIIPIENQKKLIEKLEKFTFYTKTVLKIQTQKLNHLKVLKSSLLDQAFKGEL